MPLNLKHMPKGISYTVALALKSPMFHSLTPDPGVLVGSPYHTSADPPCSPCILYFMPEAALHDVIVSIAAYSSSLRKHF